MRIIPCSWRSLWVRGCRRIKREILAAFQWAYLHFYALPMLRWCGDVNPPVSIARGYGSFLLISDASVLKLAVLLKSTLRKEYECYVTLRDLHPTLLTLLPHYRLLRRPLLVALQSEKFSKLSPVEALPLAVDAHKQFRKTIRETNRLSLSQCPEIMAGLGFIAKEFGRETATTMQELTEKYLSAGSYLTGVAHGDFHSRNIMRDRDGAYRLIDLDCIRFQGIMAFDALYFSLEQVWSETGSLWTETLSQCFAMDGENIRQTLSAFETTWSNALGLVFFLDRIGQDTMNYKMHYAREQLAPIIDAVNRTTRLE